MADVRMRGVYKRFGRVRVIENVDLDVEDGEFAVFVGPSGCGKSTLLRLVAGLEDITAGALLIGGRRVNDVPPAKRGVSMVFQSYALYPHMNVYDNMAFGLKLAKHAGETVRQRVERTAGILQLDGLLDRLPKDLSGGQRQRVAIGRAIVREPGVFLFDEPLSNLDAALRVRTRLEIAKLHAELGVSMIYVTHDQVEAMTLADKIVLLNAGETVLREGSVAQIGPPLALYHRPVNRFVAGFIGSPRMNFAAGELLSADARRAEVALASGQRALAAVDARAAAAGAAVTLGVRPEHLRPEHLRADPVADDGFTLAGTVTHVERLGEASLLYLEVDGGFGGEPLTLREPGDARRSAGERLRVTLAARDCHLFDAGGRAFPRTGETAAG